VVALAGIADIEPLLECGRNLARDVDGGGSGGLDKLVGRRALLLFDERGDKASEGLEFRIVCASFDMNCMNRSWFSSVSRCCLSACSWLWRV
jgi:hypothetical protein